ncbi:hypothetical protein H2203_009231 [Taxawa tesnikishii (nom. ined.)]|nr:hypothetical protein H2203_009231 [Dothideales sp. JES 119]
MPASSVTIISSPYHVGLRNHRVGDGPNRLRQKGVYAELDRLHIPTTTVEIPSVDEFEGEIGRSFEVLRRISKAVSKAKENNAFPCVAVAAGLGIKDLGFVWLDAHDDFDTPDTNVSGYLDAMGVSMLAGQSWKGFMDTIPGHVPLNLDRFVYCGLRDQNEVQRKRVLDAKFDVVWGGEDASRNGPVHFARELRALLDKRTDMIDQPTLVHVDLDVLDESEGKVNGYEAPDGIHADDLVECLSLIPKRVAPTSLTVASFNPNQGDGSDGDRIADIGVRVIGHFMKALIENDYVKPQI